MQYQNNNKLKNALGLTYASNITSFQQHLRHVQTYLQNEKDFKQSDLINYYYEVNYLLIVHLPSDTLIPTYLTFIQNRISKIQDLVSNGDSPSEIEIAKGKALKVIKVLDDVLDTMSKAGEIRVGNSMKVDYKKYYQLSLPNNKIMKSINTDLEKQLNTVQFN
jgi:hypothetical protein